MVGSWMGIFLHPRGRNSNSQREATLNLTVGTETPFGAKTIPVSTHAKTHQERADARPGVRQRQVYLTRSDAA